MYDHTCTSRTGRSTRRLPHGVWCRASPSPKLLWHPGALVVDWLGRWGTSVRLLVEKVDVVSRVVVAVVATRSQPVIQRGLALECGVALGGLLARGL